MRTKSKNLAFLGFKAPLFVFLGVLTISLFLSTEKACTNISSLYLRPSLQMGNDNVRIFEDDSFVIYSDEQITDIISSHARSMNNK